MHNFKIPPPPPPPPPHTYTLLYTKHTLKITCSCMLLIFVVPSSVPNLILQPLQNGSNTISLRVVWDEPESVSITQYEGNYRVKSSGSWTGAFTTSNATRVHVYWNLDSGQDYEVRVRAVSVIGNGAYIIQSTTGEFSRQLQCYMYREGVYKVYYMYKMSV